MTQDAKVPAPRCNVCNKEKPLSEFDTFTYRGVINYKKTCKVCLSIKKIPKRRGGMSDRSRAILKRTQLEDFKKIRQEKRRVESKSFRERSAAERAKVIELLGGKCANKSCGISLRDVLHIDHIAGGGSKERRNANSLQRYRKVLKNPENYQLLCANCNWLKRYTNEEK
jgi:hypothetical protein